MKQDPDYLTGTNAVKAYANQTSNIEERVIPPKGRALAYSGRTFVGHDTNISVKSEYLRSDYDYFRPNRALPTTQMEAISMCMEAYNRIGIVRNIIDLMAEFASYGIRLQHPRKSTENFYVKWFNDIAKGPEISCKFIINLLKTGNVVLKRSTGKIPTIDENEWKKAINQDLKLGRDIIKKREIPIRYTFFNPCSLEIVGGELANFINKPIFELRAPASLSGSLSGKNSRDPRVQKLIESIPKDLLEQLKKNPARIPLDMDKVEVFYYKKDDWLPWAYPIISSVLSDLMMLEQMKLADISALDGAISNIRLWNIGVLDGANSILPGKGVINKLRNILSNNVGGGVIDLVWGPELKFTESNSQVWQFLGPEKYESTLNAIYDAFGIPPSLRSNSTGATGNYVSLNTFVKRLQYVRDVLVSFWKKEIGLVHKAMGFKGPLPRIIFDNMTLADEAAEKQLLINLWDRDVISTESMREIFGRIPEVEQARVKIEMGDRESDAMPEKASPYHNPDKEHDYKKLYVQSGDVTPSEVGLELKPRKDGEKSRIETQKETQIELKKINPPGSALKVGSPGRPKSITETKKRKPKPTNKPSTNANILDLSNWAQDAQEKISNYLLDTILLMFGKSNARKLTNQEAMLSEELKFHLLCQYNPYDQIDAQSVFKNLNNISQGVGINAKIAKIVDQLKMQAGDNLSIQQLRRIYINAYSIYFIDKI